MVMTVKAKAGVRPFKCTFHLHHSPLLSMTLNVYHIVTTKHFIVLYCYKPFTFTSILVRRFLIDFCKFLRIKINCH